MSGPHRPWAGEPHSAALLARVRRLLTLEQTHAETVALGTPLSVSQLHRMEQTGAGSYEAWQILGRVLGEPVERLRPAISPARGNWWIESQLTLWPASSS